MKRLISTTIFLITIFGFVLFFGCIGNKEPEEKEIKTKTPVIVTTTSHETLEETVELNATSVFRIKDNVKSNLSGYLLDVHAKLGDLVQKGQLLFSVKTKEAAALSSKLTDTSFHFTGLINIYSPLTGVIISLYKQSGDYMQEGDELAIVAEQSSLVFILEVPFELKKFVKTGNNCIISLPGDEKITGIINSEMPTVDAANQTQSFIVKPNSTSSLPENLIAKINIVKSVKFKAQTLPKDALLTDESQKDWWVMKLINDSTAVKIPVKKGIESADKVEIIDPVFNANDRIILTGNYGLSDTARIVITK